MLRFGYHHLYFISLHACFPEDKLPEKCVKDVGRIYLDSDIDDSLSQGDEKEEDKVEDN